VISACSFFKGLFFHEVNLGVCVWLVSLAWLVVGSWQCFVGSSPCEVAVVDSPLRRQLSGNLHHQCHRQEKQKTRLVRKRIHRPQCSTWEKRPDLWTCRAAQHPHQIPGGPAELTQDTLPSSAHCLKKHSKKRVSPNTRRIFGNIGLTPPMLPLVPLFSSLIWWRKPPIFPLNPETPLFSK